MEAIHSWDLFPQEAIQNLFLMLSKDGFSSNFVNGLSNWYDVEFLWLLLTDYDFFFVVHSFWPGFMKESMIEPFFLT